MTIPVKDVGVVAPGSDRATATVYRSVDDNTGYLAYYFCCHHCGNCSKHVHREAIASTGAFQHINDHLEEGSMARSPVVSDDQIRDALREAGRPVTAASLGLTGVTTARLRHVEGVVPAGTQKTGTPGRPAQLFALAS